MGWRILVFADALDVDIGHADIAGQGGYFLDLTPFPHAEVFDLELGRSITGMSTAYSPDRVGKIKSERLVQF